MKVVIGVEQDPRVQFTIEIDSLDNLPDVITLPDGSLVTQRGRYASPGNNYSYQRVTSQMIFSGEIKEWVKYSGLKG